MKRTSQTQFVNIQANLANKKDTKPQATAPFNPQPRPTSSPSPRSSIQDTSASKMMNQSRQDFNMEEAKINIESQPKNTNQPGEAFIMPKVKKPATVSLSLQRIRDNVERMDMEEIKREYYTAEGKCRDCEALITRKFRCHKLDHIKGQIEKQIAKKADSKARHAQQKTEAVVKKVQDTNLAKRTFDGLSNVAVEALEKKHKGEVAFLTGKIDQLTKGLEDTQKQLEAVQSTQNSININAEITQAQVKVLESNFEAISKTVGIHDQVLMEFVKRSQDERGQRVGITQRVIMKKDRAVEQEDQIMTGIKKAN